VVAASIMTVEYRMARGVERKDVEFEQAEAERAKGSRGRTWATAVLATLALVCAGCGSREIERPVETAREPASIPPRPAATAPDSRPRIVALGDSLTAGLGLSPDEAYPTLLQLRLNEAGLAYQVVNAGVSGDTSAGGLRRLDWALEGDVRVLIVALGGNDALRGLPIEELRRNLAEIIDRARDRKVDVILAGMEAPPNFGREYTAAFRAVYSDLGRRDGVTLVPFLLDGVAGIESMNQRDGIHPTSAGARRVADNVWTALKPLVEKQSERK
jgi:acyl-CoA thioesterase-1